MRSQDCTIPVSGLNAPEKQGNPNHIAWLDGVRGIAILAVVLIHSAQNVRSLPLPIKKLCESGQYGVQLFFILSAITISLTLSSHLLRHESLLSWWARRFFRIAPLYYFGIVAYSGINVAITHLGSTRSLGSQDPLAILLNALFLNAWFERGNNSVVPGGWSIGVEMSFYLIAPFLFILLRRSRWAVVFTLVCAAVMLAASNYSAAGNVKNNAYAYFSPLTQFPVLLLGMAFFYMTKDWITAKTTVPRSWIYAASAYGVGFSICTEIFGVWGQRSHLLAPTFAGLTSCALIVLASGPLKAVISNRLLRHIGVVSYSIYLIHFAVLVPLGFLDRINSIERTLGPTGVLALIFTLAVALSTLIAGVTRRVVELPGIGCGRLAAERLNRTLLSSQPASAGAINPDPC